MSFVISPLARMPRMMADLPELYLMRHGQTEWNLAGRVQGRQDSPLTPAGIAQAKAMGGRLAAITAAPLLRFSSPQGRAQTTAELVYSGAGFETNPDLCEICVGDWAGRTLADLSAAHPQAFEKRELGWYDHAPRGEGLSGLQARVKKFLSALPRLAQGRPTAIVTHGITLRMIRANILGISIFDEAEIFFEQDAIHHVEKNEIRLA